MIVVTLKCTNRLYYAKHTNKENFYRVNSHFRSKGLSKSFVLCWLSLILQTLLGNYLYRRDKRTPINITWRNLTLLERERWRSAETSQKHSGKLFSYSDWLLGCCKSIFLSINYFIMWNNLELELNSKFFHFGLAAETSCFLFLREGKNSKKEKRENVFPQTPKHRTPKYEEWNPKSVFRVLIQQIFGTSTRQK